MAPKERDRAEEESQMSSNVCEVRTRLFYPVYVIAYLVVVVAWVIAWWPVWVVTGKNILADPKPPFRWMDKL
jgi:hypothetical protein